MDSLFSQWNTKIPKYLEKYKEKLFSRITQYGGGSESSKTDLGKHFSNAYELYIYAFFYGLYKNESIPIAKGEKKTDFSHHIQYWGNKGQRLDRKDFSKIQDFIFMALVAKSNIDFLALEKGEGSVEEATQILIQQMEAYTNGGLTLINEKIEDNPNFFLNSISFLDLIMELKS